MTEDDIRVYKITWLYKQFCKDDLSKIENYNLAIADNFSGWHLHHRLELTLDGEFAHSKNDLIRLDMYYHRPAFELIFMKNKEHRSLHAKFLTFTDKTKNKISIANTGRKHTGQALKNIRSAASARKGKTWKVINNKRVWIYE